jgi:RHS repeat-associated protein
VTDTDEALEWDGENRLTGMWRGPWKEELAQVPFESLVGEAVAGSVVWRWGYDHRSRRVQRDEPGSGGERLRTVTVFSGGTSAAEYTETAAAGSAWTVPSAPTVQHVRGPDLGGGTKGLLYSLRNGLPTFNRYNGRGDVVAQSDIDGTTTWVASYQADGRRTSEAGTNVERHRANCLPKATRDAASGLVFQAAFAAGRSKEEDPTGLLNEGFRYRDMETGTFISRDPLGHVDGPNVYCYVRQNPWTHWDPEGLFVGALVKRINEHIITPAAEGLVGAMVDALPQSAVEQLSSSRGFESAVEAGRTVSGGIMHGSQEALGMLSPMDGAADKLLKGDLSGAVKEAAIEAGGGRVFKAAGKGLAAVKRHAGKLDEAVGALSHADDAATATATGVRESIEEASSVLAKEGGGAAKTTVHSTGQHVLPATTVRSIGKGETIASLETELAELTYKSGGLEHAIISLKGGGRSIVSGGRGGIEFGPDLKRVIGHTHPTPTGPSAEDFRMLRDTGQRHSYIYELFGGGRSRFNIKE